VTVLRDVAETDLDVFYEQQLDPEATAMAIFPARTARRSTRTGGGCSRTTRS